LLDQTLLVQQSFFFKLTMIANCHSTMEPPLYCNPSIKLWCNLANNRFLSCCLYERLKFIELSMAIKLMGIIKHERCFSNLSFIKGKLKKFLKTLDMFFFSISIRALEQCCKVLTWNRGVQAIKYLHSLTICIFAFYVVHVFFNTIFTFFESFHSFIKSISTTTALIIPLLINY
jgi:hypothetical protein